MEKDGITLEDVLSFGSFSGEGRPLVIKLIQRLLPDYEPPGPVAKAQCTTRIVEDLYNESSSSEKVNRLYIFLGSVSQRLRSILSWT